MLQYVSFYHSDVCHEEGVCYEKFSGWCKVTDKVVLNFAEDDLEVGEVGHVFTRNNPIVVFPIHLIKSPITREIDYETRFVEKHEESEAL